MTLDFMLPKAKTKFLFFSGKGGVGKTCLSSATAVWLARRGYKSLIVTTDPAPNLSDVFEQQIGHKITRVNGVENLWAMEIDPDRATEEYRNRILDPIRQFLPEETLRVMEEQLRSPCASEMAAFDKFIDFMESTEFDVVIFDTAPTGHTLRLLELPADWSKFIETSSQGAGQTCIGPVQSLAAAKDKYDRAIEIMRDKNKATFAFVLQPESIPIYETSRSIEELRTIGIDTSILIINGILPEEQCTDDFFKKRRRMQEKYLKEIDGKFKIPSVQVSLLDTEIKGLDMLSKFGAGLFGDA